MDKQIIPLPIDSHLKRVREIWQMNSNLIIKASPGSGKTTRVPMMMMEHSSQKILVVEPRRPAAKWAALRVAEENQLQLGHEVGYVFRYEGKISDQTRLLYLTEGTFLRRLMDDPELKGVGTVILDEFHERHLETDVILAVLSRLQSRLRPDLKLVVMSATLESRESKELLDYLGRENKSVEEMEIVAPPFPLSVEYIPSSSPVLKGSLERRVFHCLERALEHPGHLLIFLPGMREIRQMEAIIREWIAKNPFANDPSLPLRTYILHGDLSAEEQARAFADNKHERKIVLSTNIAESSVTIPGVQVVIDSGIHREASFSPWSGLMELKDKKISQNSAIQRAGRANRTGPGLCLRAYSQIDFLNRPERSLPEIHRSDLTETMLLLTKMGMRPDWLERPLESQWQGALQLLLRLGAVQVEGASATLELTPIGDMMLQLPLPPRLGRILVEAICCSSSELDEVLEELVQWADPQNSHRLKRSIMAKLKTEKKFVSSSKDHPQRSKNGIFLTGFSDHVAKYRGEVTQDFVCASGETLKLAAELRKELPLGAESQLWVVLEVNHRKEIVRLLPIEEDDLYELQPFPLSERIEVVFDERKKKVQLMDHLMIGQLRLESSVRPHRSLVEEDPSLQEAVLRLLIKEGEKVLLKFKESSTYHRLTWLEKYSPSGAVIQDFQEADFLREILWRKVELDEEELSVAFSERLKFHLDPQGLVPLDQFLPLAFKNTERKILPIHYESNVSPYLESYIQDFFGLESTPSIANGKLPLTLRLNGPHGRVLQVTQDLHSFWSKTYPGMRRELMREYPRHHWPELPASARAVLLKRMLTH